MIRAFMVAALAGAFLVPSAALANGGGGGGSDDNPNSGPANERVTFCHATGSATNPFVQLTIRDRAVFEGHAAQHPGDIIPPFTFRRHGQTINFPGQNFDARGQAISNNGCVVPPVVTPPVVNPPAVNPPTGTVTVPLVPPAAQGNQPQTNPRPRRCVRKRNKAGRVVLVCHRGQSTAEARRIAARKRAEARRKAERIRARKTRQRARHTGDTVRPDFTG